MVTEFLTDKIIILLLTQIHNKGLNAPLRREGRAINSLIPTPNSEHPIYYYYAFKHIMQLN